MSDKEKLFGSYFKDRPIWTNSVFIGPPPGDFICWQDWLEDASKTGIFSEVIILSNEQKEKSNDTL